MLNRAGISDVSVTATSGHLTDHYDPKTKTLRLSGGVYSSTSAAGVGVATHEAGHAIQHAVGYFPLKLRQAIVPAAGFVSRFAFIAITLGVLFSAFSAGSGYGYYLLLFGTALFSVITLFQLITLPCEFNASGRALEYMRSTGDYNSAEISASKRVLSAAALTYVAAALTSAIQLLRLLLILTGGRRRR
jgi:Zn-dependent membrane protease YugP